MDLPSGPTSPLSVTQSKLSASITDERAPAKYFVDIRAGRSAPLSVAAIKAGLAVLLPLESDPLLGGETHDLTDPNVVDYVLRLAWSGSIGFAAGAPPRSDPHAEILANMEPLRQKNVWVHQNVTAILTAVHAPGSLVLLVNPPYSFAIHWDFVQDFLSNRATYGLWVDACRFDVDVVKTWLFAPSSLELLPLASHCNHEFQCKNTRHPRMRDPHTKFPPALCAKFAKLIVPFL